MKVPSDNLPVFGYNGFLHKVSRDLRENTFDIMTLLGFNTYTGVKCFMSHKGVKNSNKKHRIYCIYTVLEYVWVIEWCAMLLLMYFSFPTIYEVQQSWLYSWASNNQKAPPRFIYWSGKKNCLWLRTHVRETLPRSFFSCQSRFI